MNSNMGLMTSMVITLALILDFILLPALLLIGHKGTDNGPAAQVAEAKEPVAIETESTENLN